MGFKVNEPNGPNEPDIIQLIKINPKITQIELANQLNLSRSTIKRILNRLQQQEIVIRKCSNRNGYCAVKE
ncbi:MarR family transcriptional regulator [Holdemanella biformis]|uniref:MarR family transcriptional regulator n=1 Tax=Holdemanella biformis TaxID=1735 RepID=UPI0034A02E26